MEFVLGKAESSVGKQKQGRALIGMWIAGYGGAFLNLNWHLKH